MAWVAVKGYRLAYDVRGGGPPLLFMHGLGADRRQTLTTLAEIEGARLIAPDLPGHGDSSVASSRPGDRIGFILYAELVIALLRELGVKRAIVGGISMGAGVAIAVALRSPALVEALFLVRPAWLDRPAHPHLTIVADVGRLVEELGPVAARQRIASRPDLEAIRACAPRAADAVLDLASGPGAAARARLLPTMVEDRPFSSMRDLERITCPALVIGNDLDPLHPADLAVQLAAAIPNARYAHLPPRYVRTAAFRAALAAELSRLQRDAARSPRLSRALV